MFIGTVVVGCVLRAGNGASMRGALIRDVSSYALAVIATTSVMASEQVRCSLHEALGPDWHCPIDIVSVSSCLLILWLNAVFLASSCM